MPAAQPSRQEVMNAGPHHAKIRVTAHVASSVCVAGSEISGKMDVECRAEKGLGLGTIMVELMAFQELNSRDHAATSTFIHTRRVFQGPGLPPSNAVLPEDEKGRFPPHHFPARRGITTFFFRFPLPLTSPASVDFGSGLAKIRYEIRASASAAWKGEIRLVTDSQEVQVVESAMQEVESAGTVVGESGKIWMQGKVLGGAVIAGQTCCIELHVKNHSSRKTSGVNVTLQRMLHLDNPPPQHANLILSDTLVTAAFHSAEYCCPPGLEGVAKLVINVPRTARTVKGGSRESGEAGADKAIPALFDIRGSVNVRLCMGIGAKDLVLSLPVVISHPAALAAEAQSLGLPNQDPVQMRTISPFPPSQSPVLSQPTGYSSYPLAASPTLPYTQLYFPPPSPQLPHILSQFPAPPTSPGLPISPILPMSPGHPMSPVLPMSPVHPTSPVLPMTPIPPMTPVPPVSPGPPMSPVHPYPHTTSPVHAYHNQPPFQPPQVYSPPRSPVHPGTPHLPQSPRRALPQPPQRKTPSKPKGPVPKGPATNAPPLPPRPTSAEPHVYEVGVDLPPSTNTPLSPSAGRIQAATEVPDPVEGKGTRALRISEHLKMSSRTRSMSPTGRRFPGPQSRPAPVESPPPEIVAEMEEGVLSPRPVHTALAEVMDRTGSADGSVTKAQVQDLERMAAEHEAERASIQSAKEPQRMDRKSPERSPRKSEQSQPAPGPRGSRENRSPGRVLPRPPPRAEGKPPNTSPISQIGSSEPPTSPKKLLQSTSAPAVTSKINDPPAPIVKPLQPVSTGLTALERRLTTKLEHPHLPPVSPTRKPVQEPEQSAPPQNEESTIDWGEIARIGKLKAFASAHKKPTIPAFTVPEIPPASFVKPKSMVVRKPVPSMYEDEDLPILPEHRTPTSSHPPSPRHTSVPIAEAKPLVRYELSDNPMPKVVTELHTPEPPASAPQSPIQSPSRTSAQMPNQPPVPPASFPAVTPQPSQEIHQKAPGSPSRPKPASRPASIPSAVQAHIASPDSNPPSPGVATSSTTEVKRLVRYELSDNPVPKVSSQPGTPKPTASVIQLPSQPSTQPTRVPVQRASVPIPSRPSQDQFSQPASTPPQSRLTSRPASAVAASSPATESKPLVRYELTDNPVPKASPRPKVPEPTPAPVRIPTQAPVQQPKTQAPPWPRPTGRPQSVAAPSQTQIQGGSRHTGFTVLSNPVIETQPLGPSDLTYEPISFTPAEPHPPVTTRDVPQSPTRSPPSLPSASQLPREDFGQPTASPTRPKPESRSQSWAPSINQTVPEHVPRFQLSDGPVSKPPVRYQLEDRPVSKPSTITPASVPVSGPEAILTNHRANLRPVSAAKPPPQPKVRPRAPPSPIPAASVPLPQSPTKVVVPSRPPAVSRPPPPPFPRLEGPVVNPAPPPIQPTSPKRRDPSPRRPRPQDPSPQPTVSNEGDVFGGQQRVISNPQGASVESQAAQKAKYFESLATGKSNKPPEKPQSAPQNTRQILQPRQANTSQPTVGTRYVQVQIQPPPGQPQSPPRAVPIRNVPSPPEIPAPRPVPSPRATHASPILNHDMPLRSPSPIFTANPVPPTLPTARSLIPITSSGFEVPAILPGRDARERAEAALREAELFRLKREAITRVPMWLGNEHTPQVPPPTRAVRSFNAMELPPQSYWDIQQPGQEEPTMAELLSRESTPVGRAAYDPQLKHPRPRPVSSKPPALLPSDRELMDKHNVQQSARGGRGGQVTAVTSIWENVKGDPAPAPASERKPQAKRFTAPVGMFGITARGVVSNEGTNPGMIKSTSVPAMVHTSQAVPVLSSTASLARPIGGGQGARTRMMPFAPSLPESQSDDTLIRKTSQSSDNIPVGQARLKELIGKYQS